MKKSELLQIIREEVGKALENPCLTKCKAKCAAVIKRAIYPGKPGDEMPPEEYRMECIPKDRDGNVVADPRQSKCWAACFVPCKDNCSKVDAAAQAKKEAEANKKKGPIASPPPKKVEPKSVPRTIWHCRTNDYCVKKFAKTIKKPYCDKSAIESVKDKHGKPRPHGRCAAGKTDTVDFDKSP